MSLRFLKKFPIVPLLAVIAVIFAGYHISHSQNPPEQTPPPIEPARSPYAKRVAGAGIVEARSENIEIAAEVPGVVSKLHVVEGDHVTVGDLLFELDARDIHSEIGIRKAELNQAQSEYDRLKKMPRKEEIPPRKARINEAEANVQEAEDAYSRQLRLNKEGVVTEEELIAARSRLQVAKAQLENAKADFDLLMAGSWEEDLQVSRSQIAQIEAQLEKFQTELTRHQVHAPPFSEPLRASDQFQEWEVLKINRRPGEFVATPPSEPIMVLGDAGPRRIRVDIDEHDIYRFRSDCPATAYPRGDGRKSYPLKFIRIEPLVVPKTSLTGDNADRVDTRVLQVIYEFEETESPIFVGQQMDVFIDLPENRSPSAER